MTPLMYVPPLYHEEYGIESLCSYVMRMSRLFGISAGQMLRFISESGSTPGRYDPDFAIPERYPVRLAGYSPAAKRFAMRIDYGMKSGDAKKMTMLKVGPALAANCMGMINKTSMYCPLCIPYMLEQSGGIYWTPLIWSLITAVRCTIHKCELVANPKPWLEPDIVRPRLSGLKEDAIADWNVAESVKLVRYTSGDEPDAVRAEAVSAFLAALRPKYETLTGKGFEALLGVSKPNYERLVDRVNRPSLSIVFRFGAACAISPLDILTLGAEALCAEDMFDLSAAPRPPPRFIKKPRAPERTKAEIRKVLQRALSGNVAPASLKEIGRTFNVTPGYIRYALPLESSEYAAKRAQRLNELAADRARSALKACEQYIARYGSPSNEREAVRGLMGETGLPKHILADALDGLLRPQRSGRRPSVGVQRSRLKQRVD
ncbi:TniQ family protein [Pinirhizobacter soli]|uniref:TniQ family protein n=1 Tax=Pinirhizobacter soli TaxID=2786953 RepID=UPI00202A3768|nr:TniQ family protein [Pinirhizobacter soli]